MSMITIGTIGKQYELLGLSQPEGLQLATSYWNAAQEWVTRPAEETISAGIFAKTFTPSSLVEALDASVLADLVKAARGQRMQQLDHDCTRLARTALGDDYGRCVKELADRFADAGEVIRNGLQQFNAEHFMDPKKILASESAAIAWHATRRAIGDLDQIRTLVVSIDSQAINDVSYFIALNDDATEHTLPTAAGIYHGHAQDMWVRLLAVPGVKPELHDRDDAAKVSSRGAELLATAPKQRKLAGQW